MKFTETKLVHEQALLPSKSAMQPCRARAFSPPAPPTRWRPGIQRRSTTKRKRTPATKTHRREETPPCRYILPSECLSSHEIDNKKGEQTNHHQQCIILHESRLHTPQHYRTASY